MNKHKAWDLWWPFGSRFRSSPGICVLQEGACFGTVLPALALLILLAMTEVR